MRIENQNIETMTLDMIDQVAGGFGDWQTEDPRSWKLTPVFPAPIPIGVGLPDYYMQ